MDFWLQYVALAISEGLGQGTKNSAELSSNPGRFARAGRACGVGNNKGKAAESDKGKAAGSDEFKTAGSDKACTKHLTGSFTTLDCIIRTWMISLIVVTLYLPIASQRIPTHVESSQCAPKFFWKPV
ncbi:hypothetical protein MMC07_000293 [Pseudocyphellaria aurata]|nr:hypothetical protein [Pseudocyphellaria aurata]